MALITCNFFSDVLNLSTTMTVILPEETSNQIGQKNRRMDGKLPVLYLLHGFSDDHTIWSRRTSIERYAASYGIAVIMPQVDHSFYLDMSYGKKYWTFIAEELPQKARSFFPLSDKREDNFVSGLSMGGYGAWLWALRHPDRFAAAASLSGVMDIATHYRQVKGESNPVANALYHIFAGEDLTDTDVDLFYLLQMLKEDKQRIPKLFQACGTEDFLWDSNKRMYQFAMELDVPITESFSAGEHEWGYWDTVIQEVLEWLPIQNNPASRKKH
ncbi:alpha/beta hydrolase [Gracilibacillus phocaeensis]|uniref:alpha/beta hydrolase n=1 Tax=Gracilibacillus phocaeensis TaxID=2042304 RepID=UPI001031461C|nr:alpha/beta hydrolase family protein [Gracilibacillus phocaeensis]